MSAAPASGKSAGAPTKSKVSTRQPLRSPAQSSNIANDNLTSCKYCQRRFATDRIEKHQEICARTLKKKRKTYDAVRHRVQGTEVEGYSKKGPKGTSVKVSLVSIYSATVFKFLLLLSSFCDADFLSLNFFHPNIQL